jgi:hypothetical protein
MALRDLALTVLELEPNEFHWVLMEAVQADSEECLGYRPIDSSTQGLPDYSEALIQGASALRVLQGLAPFGRPKAPVSMGEAMATSAAPTAPAASALPDDADSCLFTTDRSSL